MIEKFSIINGGEGKYPVKSMCAWLGVNRSSYYDWRSRPVSAAAKKRAERAQIVRFHFEDSDEVAGSRRIAAAMARAGQPASRDAVRSIMRENGWVGQRPRKRPPVTTVPAEDADQLTDKLQRDFTAEAPGLKLVGDITYVPTWEGWVYLAVVLDCFSKKVVGYAFARHMRTELIVEALAMANRNGHVRGGVTVFHSDRGSQYMSTEYKDFCTRLGVTRSVGRTGVCWDNAFAESWNATYKVERVNRMVYPTCEKAIRDGVRWIELTYNAKRLHSALGYRTPNEVDREGWKTRSAA